MGYSSGGFFSECPEDAVCWRAKEKRMRAFQSTVVSFMAALMGLSMSGTGSYGASVSGLVTASGAPVANARITLFTPNLSTFAEQRTLADGSYQISTANSGPYQLAVAALNFAYQQVLVDLRATPQTHNFALLPESSTGSWSIIGNTLPEFFDATDIGILMADGTVFFCHDTVDPIRFDPVTGLKTFPVGSSAEQGCMNAGLREDGRIMMVGGQNPTDPGSFTNAVPWVKTYSPAANAWTWLPDMQLAAGRWYPGLVRLNDGSFLVMGGGTAPSAVRTET